MMPRTIALLLLTALLATGCGDDDPDTATIEEMRVVKVSGDQAAQVPPPEVAGLRITAVVGEDGWTDEPLVARIVTGGGGAQAVVVGIAADVVPSGTLVHWHLDEGCGRLFAQTTQTDDSAYTVNRWAPGTRSGTCHARAGRLVGTQIVMDATWELEVLPGPPVFFGAARPLNNVVLTAGQTINLDSIARVRGAEAVDEYNNPIPADILLTYPITWSIVGPMENYSLDCSAWPVVQQGSGWGNFVVPPASEWPYCFRMYYEGKYLGAQIFRSQPAP